jgi:hypothetical protein
MRSRKATPGIVVVRGMGSASLQGAALLGKDVRGLGILQSSVSRGCPRRFEVVRGPWIDAKVDVLTRRSLVMVDDDVRFDRVRMTQKMTQNVSVKFYCLRQSGSRFERATNSQERRST